MPSSASRVARLRWVRIAAALSGILIAGVFATGHAAMLVALVAWHALLIAMPMAAVVLACLREGLRDVTVLALCALGGGGLVAFVQFWIWWLSPTAGAIASTAAPACAAAAIAWFASHLDRSTLRQARPLALAAAMWVTYALFLLAFGLAPSGFKLPTDAILNHWGLALPYDNALPWIFANQVARDLVTSPMSLQWLTSDRPPLQTAYFLASGATLLGRADMHYQVLGTLLQALWAPAMALLLAGFGIARGAVVAALVAGMVAGFALMNGIFTWPKLFPVAYLALVSAIVLNGSGDAMGDRRVAASVGVCVALAMLCHPGSVFFLVGLGLALVALRRIPNRRFTAVAIVLAFLTTLPWVLYQKYWDPPGNRLMKWHLADVQDVDPRSVAEAMRDAYAAISFEQLVDNKITNLRTFIGPSDFVPLVIQASTVGLSDEDAWRLRTLQFFYMGYSLGALSLAFLAWLVPTAWRKREFAASMRLFAVCLLAVIPWALVIFPRSGTVLHTGSYAVPCFLFAAAMLAFYAASRWLALAALAVHAVLVIHLYARPTPVIEGALASDYVAFNGLAVLALAATCVALWKFAANTR